MVDVLKRTATVDFVPAPDTSGILAGAISSLGHGLAGLASEKDYELSRQEAERKRLDDAAAEARAQSSLVAARLQGATALNDLYSSFDKDTDPATAAERFDKSATQIHETIAKGLTDPKAINQFDLYFGEAREAKRVTLQGEALKRETAGAVATLDSSLDTFAKLAADAKSEPERASMLDAANNNIQGLVNSGMLSAQAGEQRFSTFKKNLATLDAERQIFANPARAEELLQRNDVLTDLEPLERQRLLEKARAERLEQERALTAAKLQARQDARDALDEISSVAEAGYPVAPELIGQAKRAIAAAGEPALIARFNALNRASGLVAALRGANPREAQAAIEELDRRAGQGATGDLAAAAIAARRFYGNMSEGLAKDPLGWASRQGVIALAPLKLDGTDAPAAWQQRIRAAELTSERYGTAPTYLTDSETDALKARLSTASADEKIHTLGILNGGLGSRAGNAIASIAKDQPVAAHVAGLLMPGASSDQINTARDALRGEALLNGPNKEGATDLRPGAAARTSPAAIGVSQALGMAPEDRARVMQTADAIYAARASRLGLRGIDANPNSALSSSQSKAVYEQALNDALGATKGKDGKQYGGVASYNGRPVVAPNNIAADTFADTIHALKDPDLAAGSASGAPPMIAGHAFTSKDLRRSYLVSVGDGQYAISVTDPSIGPASIVTDAKGAPYKLDLSRVPRFDFRNIGRETIAP